MADKKTVSITDWIRSGRGAAERCAGPKWSKMVKTTMLDDLIPNLYGRMTLFRTYMDAAFLLTIGSFLLTLELFYLQLTILGFYLQLEIFCLQL